MGFDPLTSPLTTRPNPTIQLLWTPNCSSPIRLAPRRIQSPIEMGTRHIQRRLRQVPPSPLQQLSSPPAPEEQCSFLRIHFLWLCRPPAPDGSVHFYGHRQ
jgi:hypothetical protein